MASETRRPSSSADLKGGPEECFAPNSARNASMRVLSLSINFGGHGASSLSRKMRHSLPDLSARRYSISVMEMPDGLLSSGTQPYRHAKIPTYRSHAATSSIHFSTGGLCSAA